MRRLSPKPDAAAIADLQGVATPAADPPERAAIRIWRPNWPLFRLFVAAQNAWRQQPMTGLPLGLDWLQVQALAPAYEVPWNAASIDLLKAMEAEVLEIWIAEFKRRNPKLFKG